MGTPSKRLRAFMEANFPSQKAFAEAIGIQSGNLYRYIDEKSNQKFTKDSVLEKLKDLGLNIGWYLTGEGSMYALPPDAPEIEMTPSGGVLYIQGVDMIEVPLIDSAFPCGDPECNEGHITKTMIPKKYVMGVDVPNVIRCSGNSMIPKIKDGNYCVVDTFNGDINALSNGDIVVARINNEFTIKRFYNYPSGCMLIPENLDGFEPITLKEYDEARIVAIVKYIIAIDEP